MQYFFLIIFRLLFNGVLMWFLKVTFKEFSKFKMHLLTFSRSYIQMVSIQTMKKIIQ